MAFYLINGVCIESLLVFEVFYLSNLIKAKVLVKSSRIELL